MLGKLLAEVPDAKSGLFRDFVDYVSQSRVVFDTYWTGLLGLIGYLAGLGGVTLVVAIVFGLYVVPAFSEMFAQFGTPLPRLTEIVFSVSPAGVPLFAVALFVLILLVAGSATFLQRRMQRLAPMPRWPAWLPLMGPIAESYNLGLLLNLSRMLVANGVPVDRAISIAAAESGQAADMDMRRLAALADDPHASVPLAELGIASRLGLLEKELVAQCDRHLARLSMVLVDARDRFALFLKTALYVFVAIMIVAMYLPIFKMGSVV